MPHCLVSFGSNLGDRFDRIATAARLLAEDERVEHLLASRLYETPAIGGPSGQQPFLNGVALIRTSASAREVLELLQKIEGHLGRQRAVRWDSRSIDLDVVLYGDLQGHSRALAVPHPRYTARRFVLLPAVEVAGEWRDPRCGWTIAELAANLDRPVPSIALVGGARSLRESLCQKLASEFGIRAFLEPEIGIEPNIHEAWVSSFLPALPPRQNSGQTGNSIPSLVAQLQWTTPESRWPATHQIWQTVTEWPEYRLEVDSPDWAVKELASALDSMACPLKPATKDGNWWKCDSADNEM